MASAAYWLGSSAETVSLSSTAIIGSIGVITTHVEYSKALKEAGVGATVIRAGEFKALASSVEPLSDKARAQIEAHLTATYDVFIEHVAQARGDTVASADKRYGQGREFLGQSAVEAGIADSVSSFEKRLAEIEASLIDTTAKRAHNAGIPTRTSQMKVTLTEQQIAAAMAGVTAPQAAAPVEGAPASATTAPAAQPAAEPSAAAPAVEAAAQPDAVVAFLRTELSAANDKVTALTVEKTAMAGELAGLKATHEPLKALALKSLSTMRIALGGHAAADMSAESVLTEHAAASKQFEETFKAGGVAAAAPAEKATDPVRDPHHAARIAATRMAS